MRDEVAAAAEEEATPQQQRAEERERKSQRIGLIRLNYGHSPTRCDLRRLCAAYVPLPLARGPGWVNVSGPQVAWQTLSSHINSSLLFVIAKQ